jgi:putative ABC transport system permease protein
MLRELRLGVRSLAAVPRFTAVSVLTLALGVGATSAIFTVVNAVLMAPLPYRHPERRVMIWSRWTGFDKTWLSDAEIFDYRRLCRTITDVAAWDGAQGNLTGGGDPVHIGIGRVTANAFDVLGATPVVGRGFAPDEDRPHGPHVAVLSWGLWQRRYGGDPAMVGRTIQLDGVPQQIVGVMPRGFQLPTDFSQDAASPTELWLPLGLDPSALERGSHTFEAAGVLAPGATPEQASAELAALTANFTREGLYPAPMHFTAFALPLDAEIRGGVRPAICLAAGASAVLLLIACANLANLMLVRTDGRHRELAVRSALGAGSTRLVRQLLIESLLLSTAGAACGLGIAAAGVRALLSLDPGSLPRLAPAGIDLRVVAFTAAVTVATTLLFGLAPASRALRADLVESLQEGGRHATIGVARRRTRGLLVAGEVAMAVVLVIAAGLMLRSLQRLQAVDLGFEPDRTLVAHLSVPAATYDSAEKVDALFRGLADRVRALPGVRAAGLVRSLPLENTIGDWGVAIDGYVPPPGTRAMGDWQVVSPGALAALGERIVSGRDIQPSDTSTSLQVALVNETMARAYWPGRSPLGHRFKMGSREAPRPWITIVGLVADVRHNGVTGAPKAKFYRPLSQFTAGLGGSSVVLRTFALVVRTSGNPTALVAPLRATLRALDPSIPLSGVETMNDVVHAALGTPRLTGFLLGAFALLALTLAAIGVYGVLASLVSQRQHEIGIRMAIGADGARIARMVVGRGLALAAAGIAAGLAAAAALTRLMQDLLFGVTALDPATFVVVPLLLTVVAGLASYLPARRATRVDPMRALRAD